jgi:hypothetical protein
VILTGAQLYSPVVGRFLQVDSVAGGSATAYDYCNADAVNCTDLDGTWTFKGIVSGITKVASVAAFIPGPIGSVAAGIAAVGYAAQGNKAMAITMGLTAVAQSVGAGVAVRAVATGVSRATSIARTAGQSVARALPKIGRAKAPFKSTIAIGNKAHREFENYVVNRLREGLPRTFKCGSGNCRPDGLTSTGGSIELKPDNPAVIARGARQLRKYEASIGKSGQLWAYRMTRSGKFNFRKVSG